MPLPGFAVVEDDGGKDVVLESFSKSDGLMAHINPLGLSLVTDEAAMGVPKGTIYGWSDNVCAGEELNQIMLDGSRTVV